MVLLPEALAALDASAEWLGDRKIWMSDRLVRDVPGFPRAAVAGALVVRAGRGVPSAGSLVLTREAQVQDIAWGGTLLKPSGDALLKVRRLGELLL